MLGVGGAVTISVMIGRNQKEKVNKVFTTTVLLCLLVGCFMCFFGLCFPDAFAKLLGASPDLIDYVKKYLFPLQLTAIIYILNSTMQVIIRADYNPKLVMLAAVSGNLVNIVFDWLFIGVFNWGMFGEAAATALGPIVAICILSFHYIKKKNTFSLTRNFFEWDILQRIFKNGIGTFILELSLGAVVIFFNIVLLDVSGQDVVAVFAIISNIAYVGKGIFNGISQAAQPIISTNYGARNMTRVKQTLHTAFCLPAYFLIVLLSFDSAFPRSHCRLLHQCQGNVSAGPWRMGCENLLHFICLYSGEYRIDVLLPIRRKHQGNDADCHTKRFDLCFDWFIHLPEFLRRTWRLDHHHLFRGHGITRRPANQTKNRPTVVATSQSLTIHNITKKMTALLHISNKPSSFLISL